MSSAISLNLDQSKILSSGNGLYSVDGKQKDGHNRKTNIFKTRTFYNNNNNNSVNEMVN